MDKITKTNWCKQAQELSDSEKTTEMFEKQKEDDESQGISNPFSDDTILLGQETQSLAEC